MHSLWITRSNSTEFYSSEDDSSLPFITLKGTALGGLVIWTIIANILVFVVLYKNPRLQTVPNFLVGNLAFSDLCLGLVVLPLAAVYAVTLRWSFGEFVCEIWLSSDVLCSTASIWNLSIIGLDRYWAITSPITYMTKRTMRSAVIMIVGVWALSMLISVAPFLGWRKLSEKGNYFFNNETSTYQCGFLDLPSYSIYSATGSFFIPLMVMFFVYFQIYRAFAEHKARHLYRQKVLKKHIESTILHEISHVLPMPLPMINEKYGKDDEEEEDENDETSESGSYSDEEEEEEEQDLDPRKEDAGSMMTNSTLIERTYSISLNSKSPIQNGERQPLRRVRSARQKKPTLKETGRSKTSANIIVASSSSPNHLKSIQKQKTDFTPNSTPSNSRRVLINDHKCTVQQSQRKKKEAHQIGHGKKQPAAISAAKEKRGVKVLGIILGCFTVCWTPFFIMYSITGLCQQCRPNPHVEQFITWLGYSNSSMNPIIYTVFNRDYQNALKRLFTRNTIPGAGGAGKKRKPQAV